MKTALVLATLLIPFAAFAAAEQKGTAAKTPGVRPRALGTPKAGAARGPRLNDPGSPAAWLYRATPEQRDRAIEKLRPLQQERIRRNLAWFDSLPKEDQEIVIKRTERFSALSPEKRRAFALQLQTLNRMAAPRRQAIGAALRRLQRMPDERRAAILASPEFRERFSADEQKIILDLSEVMIPSEDLHP